MQQRSQRCVAGFLSGHLALVDLPPDREVVAPPGEVQTNDRARKRSGDGDGFTRRRGRPDLPSEYLCRRADDGRDECRRSGWTRLTNPGALNPPITAHGGVPKLLGIRLRCRIGGSRMVVERGGSTRRFPVLCQLLAVYASAMGWLRRSFALRRSANLTTLPSLRGAVGSHRDRRSEIGRAIGLPREREFPTGFGGVAVSRKRR